MFKKNYCVALVLMSLTAAPLAQADQGAVCESLTGLAKKEYAELVAKAQATRSENEYLSIETAAKLFVARIDDTGRNLIEAVRKKQVAPERVAKELDSSIADQAESDLAGAAGDAYWRSSRNSLFVRGSLLPGDVPSLYVKSCVHGGSYDTYMMCLMVDLLKPASTYNAQIEAQLDAFTSKPTMSEAKYVSDNLPEICKASGAVVPNATKQADSSHVKTVDPELPAAYRLHHNS